MENKVKQDDLGPLREDIFVEATKKLEELMSQNNRAFLLGAGCSRCAGLPLTSELTEEVLKSKSLNASTNKILTLIRKQFEGSIKATIEDYMSELVDLLTIAERRLECNAKEKEVIIDGDKYSGDKLRTALMEIKESIVACIESKKLDISIHRQFITAVHKMLRSGKAESANLVDYFILNYDNLIEDVLALECLAYADGFIGGATAWWNAESFSANNISARVLKIHGSIDWFCFNEDVIPRRIREGGEAFTSLSPYKKVMIWPASTKYQETQHDPYAQIISMLRKTLRPLLHSETILTICGYRFNDSHINIEIDRALRESEGRLTILVFTELDEPEGQLGIWFKDVTLNEQVRIYAKGGFYHGSTSIKSKVPLPWWKFENLVRLLGGER